MRVSEGSANFWQRGFRALCIVYGIVILATFMDYGVTTDEPLHVAYGEHIAQWYASGFSDHTVFTASNLWLYGGLFDTVIHLLRQVAPMDVYDLRHLVCALVGLLGVLGAYRVGTALGGPMAGFASALFLVLTPRFYGHAFNNTKDVPFAVAYLWSLYGLIRCVGALPNLPRHLIWQTGLAIGCAFGVRASAALLVMYLGLFFALRYVQLMRNDRDVVIQVWPRTLIQVVGIGAMVYAVLFPVYPWLHLHPVTGLWDSVTAFASFPEVHYNFFEGRYIASDALPRYYASKWFLITLPEFVFLGLIVGLVALFAGRSKSWMQNPKTLQAGLLMFAALFPLAFGAISRTPLLNGIRHMTFVIPPLVILSALGVVAGVARISHQRIKRVLLAGVLCMVLITLGDLIAMHPNQVVYFNRLFAGGIEKASQNYELDYWHNASKQGLRWIEVQTPDTDRKVVIGSFYKNVPLMLRDQRYAFTLEPHRADFYLGTAWFDHHRAVPGEILHTVEAKGVPILYVIRPDSAYRSDPFFDASPLMHDRMGDFYRAQGDLETALRFYEQALDRLSGGFRATWLDSSGILNKMSNVALGLDRLDMAMAYHDRIPKRRLFAGSFANNVGVYLRGKGDPAQALAWLEGAVEVAPDYFNARMNLANLYLDLRDTIQAAASLRAAAKRQPSEAHWQIEVGEIFYRLGYFEDALTCFQRVTSLHSSHAEGHYLSGIAHSALERYREARMDFEQVVHIDPTRADAFQNLGLMCLYLGDSHAAVDALQKAIALKPEESMPYTFLGIAYGNLKAYDAAREAFDRALVIDPKNLEAKKHSAFLQSMMGK